MRLRISKIISAFFILFVPLLFSSCLLLLADDEQNPHDDFSLKVCDSISGGGGFFYKIFIQRDFDMNTSEHKKRNSLLFTEYEESYSLEYYDEAEGKYIEVNDTDEPTFFIFNGYKSEYEANRTYKREGTGSESIYTNDKLYAKYTVPGKYRFSFTLTGKNKANQTITLQSETKEFECLSF